MQLAFDSPRPDQGDEKFTGTCNPGPTPGSPTSKAQAGCAVESRRRRNAKASSDRAMSEEVLKSSSTYVAWCPTSKVQTTKIMKTIVVLPAYNAEKTLEKTVREISREHVQEIILVDDGSSDRTVGLAQKLGLVFERQTRIEAMGRIRRHAIAWLWSGALISS